jgi:hypothetical protein
MNSGRTDLISKMLETRNDLSRFNELLVNGSIEMKVIPCLNFSNLGPGEDELFTLLLHAGYITEVKNSNSKEFTIPNYEVRECMISFLPYLLGKALPKQHNIDSFAIAFHNLVDNGENYLQFLNEELLTETPNGSINESYFQCLVNGLHIEASYKDKSSNYCIRSEITTHFGTRLDCIIFPVKDRSKTVIIQEFKKTDVMSKVDEILELALWQIYCQKYLDGISIIPKEKWDTVIIRAIVFYFDLQVQKWSAKMVEKIHSREESELIDKEFLNSEAKGTKSALLGEEYFKSSGIELRKNFLKKKNVDSLHKFLEEIINPTFIIQGGLDESSNILRTDSIVEIHQKRENDGSTIEPAKKKKTKDNSIDFC